MSKESDAAFERFSHSATSCIRHLVYSRPYTKRQLDETRKVEEAAWNAGVDWAVGLEGERVQSERMHRLMDMMLGKGLLRKKEGGEE